MNIKELRKYLKQFPDDAEVECIEVQTWGDYEHSYQTIKPDFIECTVDSKTNKSTVRIGGEY